MTASVFCQIAGVVLIVVAIWGFITGDHVLIFHVNTTHNIVHLASGVIALICGFVGEAAARTFCLIFGAVYGLVAILGFARVEAAIALLHLNPADNWLHLFIALAFLGVGIGTGLQRHRTDGRPLAGSI
jgi:hypothetical protein